MKAVPAARRARLEAGLALADTLRRAPEIQAGSPVRAADGSLTVIVDGAAIALRRFVDGRPLDPDDPIDQQWWGDRLGTVHRRIADFTHSGMPGWHWLEPEADHLDLEPWLRPAVAAALAELTKLQITDRLTVGPLHGDPGPEAFLLDAATGRVGVVGWGSCHYGPRVYDLAVAVRRAGGPDRAAGLIEAYAAAGPVPAGEVEAALPTMLRFHWALRADRYARRLARTGARSGDPCDPGEPASRAALDDARTALLA